MTQTSSYGCVQLLLAAVVAYFPQNAGAARLLSGTPISLELIQNISSRYSQPGSPVYFRVQRDVVVDGDIAVAAGTLATGNLSNLQDRGRVARSASLSLDAPFVSAIDGQAVRVIADMKRAGRDRDDALATGIILFGALGLLTHGAEVWIPAGSLLEAQVLNDQTIRSERKSALEPPATARFHATVIGERIDGLGSGAVVFNVDHPPALGMLQIQLRGDNELSAAAQRLGPWEVVQVGDLQLPKPVATASEGATISFTAWSVLQYCRQGLNRLVLRASFSEGFMEAEMQLQFDPAIRR